MDSRLIKYNTKSSNISVNLPMFIPVYRPDYPFELFSDSFLEYGLNSVMVNSFLLYRNKTLKQKFENGYTLRSHLNNFKGIICTDSGAFQQLSGNKVVLESEEIVKFQNLIKTDVAAPLDLITPPTINYEETLQRMIVSHHRIEQAKVLCTYSDLAAIQQGGAFYKLRQQHIRDLKRIGFTYYGIGSMVPFFNKNHDLLFTCNVIRDARSVIGSSAAMHVYGAGDPLDMAFMYKAGANIFDSSSYAHYAKGGFYMTPYGSVQKASACRELNFKCDCPACRCHQLSEFFAKNNKSVQLLQEHNLYTLLDTVRKFKEKLSHHSFDEYLNEIYSVHINNREIFPMSKLEESWDGFLSNKIIEDAHIETESNLKIFKPEITMTTNNDDFSNLELEVINQMSNDIVDKYKIEYDIVFSYIKQELVLPKNTDMRKKISEQISVKNVFRLSVFKNFNNYIKKSIYYNLRRYKTSDYDFEADLSKFLNATKEESVFLIDFLLKKHISSRERFPYKEDFLSYINSIDFSNKTIIDIGCGFNPLMLDETFFKQIKTYVAVDIDVQSVELVKAFAKKYEIVNLHTFKWDISEGYEILRKQIDFDAFDYAFVFKVIPVVARHDNNNNCLDVLGKFNAKKMIITASKESMTKHQSIEKRERNTLDSFIKKYNWTIEENIEMGTEFGYLISNS